MFLEAFTALLMKSEICNLLKNMFWKMSFEGRVSEKLVYNIYIGQHNAKIGYISKYGGPLIWLLIQTFSKENNARLAKRSRLNPHPTFSSELLLLWDILVHLNQQFSRERGSARAIDWIEEVFVSGSLSQLTLLILSSYYRLYFI